jgi:hypothetical protein
VVLTPDAIMIYKNVSFLSKRICVDILLGRK